MMKLFRKLHLWLSVPFGLIITLICFSGAMLVFEPEITRCVRHEVYFVASTDGDELPMAELMETVKASLPDSISITGVTVYNDSERTYQVNLSKPRRASLFVDQYNGKITGHYERLAFFATMFKLHRWLLDGANPHGDGLKTGKLLVGISTLIFVIALISGVALWWPRARRDFRHSLSIRTDGGWRGFWKSLHVAGGMYALVIVLAMALTGLTWSFDWYRTAFYAVCGVEHTPRNFTAAGAKDKEDGNSDGARHHHRGSSDGHTRHGRRHSEFGRWQQVYDELKSQNPDAPQISIAAASANVALGNLGNTRASDVYEFDRHTGVVKLSTKYRDSVPADKLRGWIYSIHTGGLGGMATRVLWFFAALLAASLPLTGYYIWFRHLMKKKPHTQL